MNGYSRDDAPKTVIEFEGCVWFDGHSAISDDELEWPCVEICNGEQSFCEVWLGQVESMCAGASERSKRVMLGFLMDEIVKQAVEDFLETFESWQTDADAATTSRLVKELEVWLIKISHDQAN